MFSLPAKKYRAGFTIIEMLVSLALFTIVITIAVGSFLSLIGGSGKLQGEQSIMSSLTFALDTMTREIRTGTYYFCSNNAGNGDDTDGNSNDLTVTQSCASGAAGMSFVEAGSSLSSGSGSGRITYIYNAGAKTIERQIGTNSGSRESIVSSDVKLNNVQFFVTGTTPMGSGSDVLQPTVTIIVEAQDPNDPTGKVYTLETTVTQRQLDL